LKCAYIHTGEPKKHIEKKERERGRARKETKNEKNENVLDKKLSRQ
jgi:hypothetical protein